MKKYDKDSELDIEMFVINVITPLVAQFNGVLRATTTAYINSNYKTYRRTVKIIANDGSTIKEIDYMGKDIPYIIKAVYKEFINTLSN